MRRFLTLAVCVCFGLNLNKGNAQVTVFNTDFNAGSPSQISGAGDIESVQGYAGLGHPGNQFSGDFLRNASTGNPAAASVLTLTNLPSHTSVNVDFLLAAIDSWDSTNGFPAPDFFNVTVDGTTVFQTTFVNASGTVTYNGDDIGDGLQNRGFNTSNGGYDDRAYDMYSEPALQNIAHSASTLTVSWFASGGGWQGGNDESWAIDNLRVQINPVNSVPEPGAVALLLAGGLTGTGLFLRYRRK